MPAVKIQTQQQNIALPQVAPEVPAGTVPAGSPQLVPAHRPKMPLPGECAAQVAQEHLKRGGTLWFDFCLLTLVVGDCSDLPLFPFQAPEKVFSLLLFSPD